MRNILLFTAKEYRLPASFTTYPQHPHTHLHSCHFLTFSPTFVDGRFLTELLGQVVQSLQAADLVEEPFLVALFGTLQVAPCVVDVLRGRRVFESPSSVILNVLSCYAGFRLLLAEAPLPHFLVATHKSPSVTFTWTLFSSWS